MGSDGGSVTELRGLDDVRTYINNFVDRWVGSVSQTKGYSSSEISDIEKRLGVRMPEALSFVYHNYGRRPDIVSNQDLLVPLDELQIDSSVLVYRIENQACARWGISTVAISGGDLDPPVLFCSDVEGSTSDWSTFFDKTSLAMVELVLSETMFSGSVFSDNRPQVEEDARLVPELLPQGPLPGYPLWSGLEGEEVTWFVEEDRLVRLDGNDWLWACGLTQEALDDLRSSLPGEWLGV